MKQKDTPNISENSYLGREWKWHAGGRDGCQTSLSIPFDTALIPELHDCFKYSKHKIV